MSLRLRPAEPADVPRRANLPKVRGDGAWIFCDGAEVVLVDRRDRRYRVARTERDELLVSSARGQQLGLSIPEGRSIFFDSIAPAPGLRADLPGLHATYAALLECEDRLTTQSANASWGVVLGDCPEPEGQWMRLDDRSPQVTWRTAGGARSQARGSAAGPAVSEARGGRARLLALLLGLVGALVGGAMAGLYLREVLSASEAAPVEAVATATAPQRVATSPPPEITEVVPSGAARPSGVPALPVSSAVASVAAPPVPAPVAAVVPIPPPSEPAVDGSPLPAEVAPSEKASRPAPPVEVQASPAGTRTIISGRAKVVMVEPPPSPQGLPDAIPLRVDLYDEAEQELVLADIACGADTTCSTWSWRVGNPPVRDPWVLRSSLARAGAITVNLTVGGKPARRCSVTVPAELDKARRLTLVVGRPPWDGEGCGVSSLRAG